MSSPGAWLEQRLPLGRFLTFLRHKTVPAHHHSVWYYFGGITLLLFGIQVATGILLLLYYRPTSDAAFESVRQVVAHVPFGWLIRSVHAWGANLMICAAFVHLFSVFFMRGYRPPRELTWMSGFVLLALTLGFGFSGYLLPWNELAYFATKVGTDIVGVVPVIGHPVLLFLRGGEDVTGATLTRFFGFHVALLPLTATVILLVHLALVQVHGISKPIGKERTAHDVPFYPNFTLREAIVWMLTLAVLVSLATFLPWELGVKADPLTPAPAGIRPEWYFTFMSQTFKYLPPMILGFEGERVGVLTFGTAGALLFLIPFLDCAARRERASALVSALGGAIIAYMVALTALAYFRPY
jgi:quinol-cytochrome oxidoreductase complex cytochrome b subunit